MLLVAAPTAASTDVSRMEIASRFPGLASGLAVDRAGDEARFLDVRPKREENRVEEALREARSGLAVPQGIE
jgi:hypothetical protein